MEDQQLVSSLMEEDVLKGLQQPEKKLNSKYFYDERGSKLFEEICTLDEYYLTTTEIKILKKNVDEISNFIGENALIIEFGSGSSIKTRILLRHLIKIAGYVPVDISEEFLFKAASGIHEDFPRLKIKPVAADYTKPFSLPFVNDAQKNIIFFPGSTIGNFTPGQAAKFLLDSSSLLGNNGGLLIGVDTKKDSELIEKAYNDSRGITAAFNKNLLIRINRELGADFNTDLFRHKAIYNRVKGRIEMHLVSVTDQTVFVAGMPIKFCEGESIHTENSHKYHPDEFVELISDKYDLKKLWMDEDSLFAVYYFET